MRAYAYSLARECLYVLKVNYYPLFRDELYIF